MVNVSVKRIISFENFILFPKLLQRNYKQNVSLQRIKIFRSGKSHDVPAQKYSVLRNI